MPEPFFRQERFPALWSAFQIAVGGSVDKRRLCVEAWRGERRVLEVGCSAGNLTPAFAGRPGVDYVGLDVDARAIALARRRFAGIPGVRFVAEDLRSDVLRGEVFDLVLLAGLCHHLADEDCLEIVDAAGRVVAPRGSVVVVDPLVPGPRDGWLVRRYVALDRGRSIRGAEELLALLRRSSMLDVVAMDERLVGATPLHWPVCARFGVCRLAPRAR